MNYKALIAATMLALLAGTTLAESGFLSDYSKLQPAQDGPPGTDRVDIASDGIERIGKYTAVMVDQPEILFSADRSTAV